MNPQVISALIAASVSVVLAVVTLVTARWQLRSKMSELELKKQEVEKIGAKLQAEAEALRQTLMRDVLAQRMNAYAALWHVFISYERYPVLSQETEILLEVILNSCELL